MWGYGARHDMLSQGALDPLMAKAIVIAAGDDKVALVGIDLGRGPTEAMMKVIREEIADKAGIRHVLITGSHTHHGPVIELTDEPGLGKGKFDAAVAYSKELPDLLIEAILDADKDLKPARVGVATESVPLNRNRQTKREPKATDPMLAVLRFDDEAGKPIADPRQLRRAPGDDRHQGCSSTRPTIPASSRTRSRPSCRPNASSCRARPAT